MFRTTLHQRLFILILLIIGRSLAAQNLVLNPSFEEFDECPKASGITSRKLIPHWNNPTKGTADFFSRNCKTENASVPRNWLGKADPHEGKSYLGIIAGETLDEDELKKKKVTTREYIQGEFKEPLVKGKKYAVKFYVCYGDNSLHTINQIGAYISKRETDESTWGALNYRPQVVSGDLRNNRGWILVSGTYTALGGEKYIVIGNFLNDEQTKYNQVTNKKVPNTYAYYFIDDVSVTETDGGEVVEEFEEGNKPISSAKPKVLNITSPYITFEQDKWELSDKAKLKLDSIVDYLNKNPDYKLLISGYSDKRIEEKTKNLSENRANAVYDYLFSKGIPIHLINYVYMPSDADTNAAFGSQNEAERAKYRRVEIEPFKE